MTARSRAERAFARAFRNGRRVAWINDHLCACGGRHAACGGRTVNAHVRSRGAGGTWRDVIPLSWGCHQAQTDHGWAAYGAAGGLSRAEAEALAADFAQREPPSDDHLAC